MCFTLRTVFYTVMSSIEQHSTELSFLPASGKKTAHKHYFLCASAWMPEPQSSIPVWTFLCVCVWGSKCLMYAVRSVADFVTCPHARSSLNYKTVVAEHSRWTSRHKPWVVFQHVQHGINFVDMALTCLKRISCWIVYGQTLKHQCVVAVQMLAGLVVVIDISLLLIFPYVSCKRLIMWEKGTIWSDHVQDLNTFKKVLSVCFVLADRG